MKKLKIQIAKWLLKKSVKWSEIQPLDFYIMFSKQINNEKDIRAKEHFGKFRHINKWGYGSISDNIKEIDSKAIEETFLL